MPGELSAVPPSGRRCPPHTPSRALRADPAGTHLPSRFERLAGVTGREGWAESPVPSMTQSKTGEPPAGAPPGTPLGRESVGLPQTLDSSPRGGGLESEDAAPPAELLARSGLLPRVPCIRQDATFPSCSPLPTAGWPCGSGAWDQAAVAPPQGSRCPRLCGRVPAPRSGVGCGVQEQTPPRGMTLRSSFLHWIHGGLRHCPLGVTAGGDPVLLGCRERAPGMQGCTGRGRVSFPLFDERNSQPPGPPQWASAQLSWHIRGFCHLPAITRCPLVSRASPRSSLGLALGRLGSPPLPHLSGRSLMPLRTPRRKPRKNGPNAWL